MFTHYLNKGWIEIITGSMFSGKSEELIRRVLRAKYARQKVQVFNHTWDNRYKEDGISSHAGLFFSADLVRNVAEIKEKLGDGYVDLVAIDEIHFFDKEIIPFLEDLAFAGTRVIVAGLDQDFKGDPFITTAELLIKAEVVDKLNAICAVCCAPASKSQRIINGQPARRDDPVILVGASEYYEPRCRNCHKILE